MKEINREFPLIYNNNNNNFIGKAKDWETKFHALNTCTHLVNMNNFTCFWYIFVDICKYLIRVRKAMFFLHTINEKMSKLAKNNAKYLLDTLK